MNNTPNTHGGPRKNAGRKPKDPSGPVVRVTTWITAKQAKYFADNPRLNKTAQIQAALDAWISPTDNKKLWKMATLIVEKIKAAQCVPSEKIDWNMLEELWFEWLEEQRWS